MSKQDIQKVINKLPELTDFGIGIYGGGKNLTPTERKTKFKEEQENLLSNVEQFEKTCDWLINIQKTKQINPNRTSYGIKHIASRYVGYITNGVFIAAAIHCGFKFKVNQSSPNVMFNMSERSIKELSKKADLLNLRQDY